MAGNKQVPLRWGEGGPIIGTASVDENGLIMAEIDDRFDDRFNMGQVHGLSIFTKEDGGS